MDVTTIAEQLFFTTVRVDTAAPSGARGTGTAFLFAHKHGQQTFPFVVTNKHVVMGMKSGALTFLQRKDLKPSLGTGFQLNITDWPDVWFGHPSPDIDIAICPFAPLEAHIKANNHVDLFYRYITSDMIPDQTQLADLDALESVTFIGYPNGIWGKANLLPVARRGISATPLAVEFREYSPILDRRVSFRRLKRQSRLPAQPGNVL